MAEQFFNPNPDRIIEVFDLFGEKHQRNLKNFRFRISVYGILIRKGLILVQRHPKLKSYGLPGGGMEIGERISEALRREFKEETGLSVRMGRLVTVGEDFFTCEGKDAHSILLFYKVFKAGGQILKEGNEKDTGEVKFMELKKLEEKHTQRVFWPTIKKLKNNRVL